MGNISAEESQVILDVFLILLTGLAVLTRFVIRAKSKASVGADDWWALASLVFFYTVIAIQFAAFARTRLRSAVAPEDQEYIAKLGFASAPFSISTVAAAKISVLWLYRRIFPTETFQRRSLIVGGCVVIYWITAITGFLFRCTPIRAAWKEVSRGHCISAVTFFLALELYNCVLDIVILSLPVRLVQKLQMSLRQKVAVVVVFLSGGLVLVAGIVRMALIYKPGLSLPPSVTASTITANLENVFAIICACLPTYGPILSRFSPICSWTRSQHNRQRTKSHAWEEASALRVNGSYATPDLSPSKSNLDSDLGVENRSGLGKPRGIFGQSTDATDPDSTEHSHEFHTFNESRFTEAV